jgi:hypothetical protein
MTFAIVIGAGSLAASSPAMADSADAYIDQLAEGADTPSLSWGRLR